MNREEVDEMMGKLISSCDAVNLLSAVTYMSCIAIKICSKDESTDNDVYEIFMNGLKEGVTLLREEDKK